MAYDKNGNWDYESTAMERQLTRRPSKIGEAIVGFMKLIGALLLLGVAIGVLVAISTGGYYIAGRAAGAGVRDAVQRK
jgi:hypothetical protein